MSFANFTDMINMVKARKNKKRYAVVAAESKPILESVLSAYQDGFLDPILIGDAQVISGYVEEISGSTEGITIIPAESPQDSAQKAVDLVNQGQADCIIKGHIETGPLMSVVLRRNNKLQTGGIVSSVTILEVPSYHKLLTCTDGGITLFPNLGQQKMIIENAVGVLRRLGIDCPKVAVLAAVEVVNPKIPATVDASELMKMNKRGEIKNCIVEGPISYDLAISKKAALDKGFESPVAGNADLLVFPDINAANFTIKSLIYSAGAKLAGLVLGTRVPILTQSRSASFEDRYFSIALVAAGYFE